MLQIYSDDPYNKPNGKEGVFILPPIILPIPNGLSKDDRLKKDDPLVLTLLAFLPDSSKFPLSGIIGIADGACRQSDRCVSGSPIYDRY